MRRLWLASGIFWSFPTIPGHGAVMGRLTWWLEEWLEWQGYDLQPRGSRLIGAGGSRLIGALRPALGAFLTLPTLLITLPESALPLGSRIPREAVNMSHRGHNSTYRLLRGSIRP